MRSSSRDGNWATQLGALATDSSVICFDNARGPCTPNTLTRIENGPYPPIPPRVPTMQ